jgi:hypothetical protein
MRGVAIVIQLLVSLIVAATLMPVLLVGVPSLQDRTAGPAVAVGVVVFVFILVRVLWPRHRA